MPVVAYEVTPAQEEPSQIDILTEKITKLDEQIVDLITRRDALVDSRAALLNTDVNQTEVI